MLKKIIKLMMVISWMSIIFIFSNDTGEKSSQKSDGFIIKTVELIKNRSLSGEEKEKYIKYLVVPVRKMAHAFIYFVLGILVINYLSSFGLNKKMLFLSLVVCFLYACSDEVHQLFILGRSGQIRDVLIDSLGSILGVVSYYKIRRGRCYEQEN